MWKSCSLLTQHPQNALLAFGVSLVTDDDFLAAACAPGGRGVWKSPAELDGAVEDDGDASVHDEDNAHGHDEEEQ